MGAQQGTILLQTPALARAAVPKKKKPDCHRIFAYLRDELRGINYLTTNIAPHVESVNLSRKRLRKFSTVPSHQLDTYPKLKIVPISTPLTTDTGTDPHFPPSLLSAADRGSSDDPGRTPLQIGRQDTHPPFCWES